VPSRACIRCGPSCPASSAADQQFAFTSDASADRYPNATSALWRCGIQNCSPGTVTGGVAEPEPDLAVVAENIGGRGNTFVKRSS